MAVKHEKDGTRPLLLLFFLSGATSLAYQVLWVRELQLVFGTSTFAISTVLAAFMGGLALGGFAMARYADRLRQPLATYGKLEIGIGLYALVFPWLVQLVTPVYLSVWRTLEPGPVLFGAIQFVLVGSTLLLPTAAMGATLPLLARFSIRHLASAGDRVGTLYAVNTIGAAVGTWLCGFVLLPHLGRFSTTLVAVAANIGLGIAALLLDSRAPRTAATGKQTTGKQARAAEGHGPGKQAPATASASDRGPLVPVALALGFAGFAVLVYEVAWARLLGLILGGSTYTFSLVLLVFLVGIAVGGKVGGRLADRLITTGGRSKLLIAFALIEVAIALLSYVAMYLYPELPVWYVWLFDALNVRESPEAVWWVSLAVAGLVMAPPTVLMGMHFPVAVRAVVASDQKLGGPVGVLYGASTLGGVVGAFLAGFVLLPNLWMQGTIFAAALAGLAAAAFLMFHASREEMRRWFPTAAVGVVSMALGLLFVAQRPPWNPLLMTAGLYHYATAFQDHTRAGIRAFSVDLYDLLFYDEGLTNVVTVAQNKGSSHLWLANNGKVDASTTTDMPTQVLLSALPMQFVETPEDVLIVGLASGISAGVAAESPEVRRLGIVEIEPAVERAAGFFTEWNRNVLADPRTRVIHNDARNHLLLTPAASYDIVISEPSNPWIAGVANLFTREFLELGRTRLKPGGVWSQWIQMYGMDAGDLQSLLRTFADVYPHVRVYASIDPADLIVLGSDAPLDLAQERIARLLGRHHLTGDLVRLGLRSTVELTGLFLLDRPAVLAMSATAPLNTDDNMLIEYSAPLNLHRDTRAENFVMLMRNARLPEDALGADASLWRELAQVYQQRRDLRFRPAMNRAGELDARGSGAETTRSVAPQ